MERTDANGPGPGGAHLDEATWERLACGELSAPERIRARTHIAACGECARIDAALSTLREEALTFDPGVPERSAAPAARPVVRWLAMAAGLAVAVGGAAYLLRSPALQPDGPATVRGAQDARPQARAPLGAQKVAPQSFSWAPIPHARRYQVKLFSADAQPIWTSPPIEGTTTPWPDGFSAPGTYYWQVTALPLDVSSELVDVTIGPGADRR